MIGNDIVDLALAQKESNWKRNRFLDKIFTDKEQLLIFNAKHQEVMVWNLWSRKEAAYKIYNRQTEIRQYIPLKLECHNLEIIDGLIFGKVLIKHFIFFTKTEISPQFIHSIAVENVRDFDEIITLENRKNILINNGIPSFFDKGIMSLRHASISHHGRFERIITV